MTVEPSLLSQDELDFIHDLFEHSQPLPSAEPRDLAERLSQTLGPLGEDLHLSIEADIDQIHLSFPVMLDNTTTQPQLEVDAPFITQLGKVDRPWRLPLASPLRLYTNNGKALPLQALELSSDSILLQTLHGRLPAQLAGLELELGKGKRLELAGHQLRRISTRRAAYSLELTSADQHSTLRRFLFTQYRLQHTTEQLAS